MANTTNRGRPLLSVGPGPEGDPGPRGGAPEARVPEDPLPDSGSSTSTRTGGQRDCRGSRSHSSGGATAGLGPLGRGWPWPLPLFVHCAAATGAPGPPWPRHRSPRLLRRVGRQTRPSVPT